MFNVIKNNNLIKLNGVKNNIGFLLYIFRGYALLLLRSNINSCYLREVVVWERSCLNFRFRLLIDKVRMMFVGTIFIISGRVCIYCKWYMSTEVYYKRFMGLVYLFVLSIVFIIIIPNLIILLLGWDGLGLTSFLLVAYYQNNKSLSAAILTALTNRIGDVLVLLSISFILNESRWLLYSNSILYVSSFLRVRLVIGGITKSAQMPFCAWLPAAMAAPTPVSSLVHSSTLVTAGVYLLLRSFNVLASSELSLVLLKILSLFTLLLAGSRAIMAFDLKKVIALSTLSQLRLIIFSISIYLPIVAFFHLVTHAVFKALLFLGAGGVIHRSEGIQDTRNFSMVWQYLPSRRGAITISILSLRGAPFMRGFFSKDLIIELRIRENGLNYWCYVVEIVGLFFTSFYGFRIVFGSIFSSNKVNVNLLRSRESDEIRLSFLSLIIGAIIVGNLLSNNNEILWYNVYINLFEMILMIIVPIVGLFGWFLIVKLYKKRLVNLKKSQRFMLRMWNVENLTSHPVKSIFFYYSVRLYRIIDQGWIEFLGPQGLYNKIGVIRKRNEYVQRAYFLSHLGFWSVLSFFLIVIRKC